MVSEAVGLAEQMKGASLVLTGEGQIDDQTVYGKTPVAVAKLAEAQMIPVIGIVGSLGTNYEVVCEHGIDALFSITPGPITLEEGLKHAEIYTEQLAENIARMLKVTGFIK